MVQESRSGKIALFLHELDKAFLPVVDGVENIVQTFSTFSKDIMNLQGSLKTIVTQIEGILKEGINLRLSLAQQAIQSVNLKEVKAEVGNHVSKFQDLTQKLILASLNLSIKAQKVEGVQGQVLEKIGEEMADFLIAMRRRMDETYKTLQQSYKELELLMSALSREIAIATFNEVKEMVDNIGDLELPPVEELILHSQFHDIFRQEVEKIRAVWDELCNIGHDASLYCLGRRAALLEKLPKEVERVRNLAEKKLDEITRALREVNYKVRSCCHTAFSRIYKLKKLTETIKSKVEDLKMRIRTLEREMPCNDSYVKRSLVKEVLMLEALWIQFSINNGQQASGGQVTANLIKKVASDLRDVDQRIVASITHWQSLNHSVKHIVQELNAELKELSKKLDAHLKNISEFFNRTREDLISLKNSFSQLTRRCIKHIEEAKRGFRWKARLILQEIERQKRQFQEQISDVLTEEEFLNGFYSFSFTEVLAEEQMQSTVEIF